MRETGWSLSAAGVWYLREVDPSKKLLLYGEIRNDNVAHNGEVFISFLVDTASSIQSVH